MVVSLLWCNVGFAKEWIFTYKNYYDMTVLGVGYNKNITKSIQMALSECQEQSKKKNLKPEGCLRHDSQKKGAWAELFNQAEKIIVWNKYVDEFEKTLKPEDIIKGRKKGKIVKKPEPVEIVKKPESDDGKIIIIGSGSGFFVSDQGHIVSNAHVVGVCKKVTKEKGNLHCIRISNKKIFFVDIL